MSRVIDGASTQFFKENRGTGRVVCQPMKVPVRLGPVCTGGAKQILSIIDPAAVSAPLAVPGRLSASWDGPRSLRSDSRDGLKYPWPDRESVSAIRPGAP